MNVGVAEAKDRLSELIDRAEQGERVIITRHGRAVVTLTPERARLSREEREALFADIRRDAERLPDLTDEEVVAAVKADRRF